MLMAKTNSKRKRVKITRFASDPKKINSISTLLSYDSQFSNLPNDPF
jgi:hypothetical protein